MSLGARSKVILVSATLLALALLLGPGHRQDTDPKRLLEQADRLGWLYNWPKARPLYAMAERLFRDAGNERNALQAKIGRIRSELQTMSFLEVSEYLSRELETPLVQKEPELRLRLLEVKGALELEVNTAMSRRAWEEARDLARRLGYKAREGRAVGELGLIAFLEGDSAEAVQLQNS